MDVICGWVASEMRRILGNENCGWNNIWYLKLDCCYILEDYWAWVGHSFNLLCCSLFNRIHISSCSTIDPIPEFVMRIKVCSSRDKFDLFIGEEVFHLFQEVVSKWGLGRLITLLR